jgi:hypothetical protein
MEANPMAKSQAKSKSGVKPKPEVTPEPVVERPKLLEKWMEPLAATKTDVEAIFADVAIHDAVGGGGYTIATLYVTRPEFESLVTTLKGALDGFVRVPAEAFDRW